MASDLEGEARRLRDGKSASSSSVRSKSSGLRTEGLDERGRPRSIMVVEADLKMQDVLRGQLKRRGYRVLVTNNPARAIERLSEDAHAADLVLFSTGALGKSALKAFNDCDKAPSLQAVPAVLLLDERHRDWQGEAAVESHRVAVAMPITLRQLRETLVKLLAAQVRQGEQGASAQ